MADKEKAGFTLLEIIFVLVIVSILYTLAIPSVSRSRESALGREAIASLRMIAAGEKIYRMELSPGAFIDCSCIDAADCSAAGGCNFLLKIDLNTEHWTYNVVAAGAAFTATADRRGAGGPGNFFNCQYSITSADTDPVVSIGPCPQ